VGSRSAALDALLKEVTGLGPGSSLVNKVMLAETYYAVPDVPSTFSVLTGVLNEVNAQTAKKISVTKAAKITSDTQAIDTAIGCSH
jgi:hypothetical protein